MYHLKNNSVDHGIAADANKIYHVVVSLEGIGGIELIDFKAIYAS